MSDTLTQPRNIVDIASGIVAQAVDSIAVCEAINAETEKRIGRECTGDDDFEYFEMECQVYESMFDICKRLMRGPTAEEADTTSVN